MAVAIVKHNAALIRGDGIDIDIEVEDDGFITIAQGMEDTICMDKDEATALYDALGMLLGSA